MRDPLDIIEQRESGGKNVPNYKYGPGFTASGHYQMINPTWRRWAKAAGVDISQYPTAMSAPKEVQRAVAAHGFQTEGFKPWEATKHLVGQEARYGSPARPTAQPAATAAAPGPTSPLPSVNVPDRGILAAAIDKIATDTAKERETQRMAQVAEATAPQAPPQQPAPAPLAPPSAPVDYAGLLLPRIKRGLLADDYSSGLLGAG